MKKSLPFISVICIFLLVSCKPKSTTITDISPNKMVNIVVKATRAGGIEPWKVDIGVKAYDFKEGHLLFELETNDVNEKSVTFDWKDDNNCIISFAEPDGEARRFQLKTDANEVQLAEINL